MNFLYTFLILATIGVSFAAPTAKLTGTGHQVDAGLDPELEAEIERLREQAEGCNANVCFALTGSNKLNADQFKNQVNFVIAMGAILAGNPLETAAVQYGIFNRPISFLTSNAFAFTTDLLQAEFANDAGSAASSGIFWCHNQLRKRPHEANKIVLITDGRNNIGRAPAVAANFFREDKGEVCVVGVGPNRDEDRLLNIAGGDPRLVLNVNSFFDLRDILAEMVQNICYTELI